MNQENAFDLSPTAILNSHHRSRLGILSPSPNFWSDHCDNQNLVVWKQCLPGPFCRRDGKSSLHHLPSVQRTVSPEAAPEFFLIFLCVFQGDGGGNPRYSIPAGRNHT